MPRSDRLICFTDLDGCLLNKSDYDYRPAVPALRRWREAGGVVVLCSSKTAGEMRLLRSELQLAAFPMTCENGGLICGAQGEADSGFQILSAERDAIVQVLRGLNTVFRFRHFAAMSLQEVCDATGLPSKAAELSMQRDCTEPLLWDDTDDRLEAFRREVESAGLTLTRGGRFWHVAGHTSKGRAMEHLLKTDTSMAGAACLTVAIGDAPIDQSMLDIADVAIGIRAPDGSLNVDVQIPPDIVPDEPGSLGWAQGMNQLMDRLGIA